MKKKEKPFRNEKGEILRPTIIGYDNKMKQPITQLMTAKERKRFMRRKKKIVNEEKKFIRESKRITTMDLPITAIPKTSGNCGFFMPQESQYRVSRA